MKPAFLPALLVALAACTPSAPPAAEDDGTASRPSHARGATSPAQAASAPPARGPGASVDASMPSPGSGTTARWDGYGALRLGMDEAQARAAWRGRLQGDVVGPDTCAYLRPEADGDFRIGFMFERGVLVRYDVAVADEPAPGGGRVGGMRSDIERLYPGRIRVQPHEYVPGGHYLRITDPALAGGALVFETDETGKVTRWRVGRAPQVDYVEGCA